MKNVVSTLLQLLGLSGNDTEASAIAPVPPDMPQLLTIFVRTNLGEKVILVCGIIC